MGSHKDRVRTPWGWASEIHLALFPEWYASSEDAFEGRHIRWADHQDFALVGGRPCYVCHPYDLDPEAFLDFLRLEELGWSVRVSGASEYSDRTVRVSIERKPARG